MTMKTKKTLQHIAAVAVVLLTLCLVFAAPVSAEDVVLTISSEGSESAETTFVVDGVITTPQSLQVILNNFSLVNGKNVILPEGTLYLKWANSHNIEGDITVIGQGTDKTTLMAIDTDGSLIRLYNRDANSVLNGDGYTFTFKDFTMDSIESIKNKANAFFVTSYNIEINVENVVFKNLNSVIEVWGLESLTNVGDGSDLSNVISITTKDTNDNDVVNYYPNKDANVGVTLNLKDVTATDNNRMVGYQVMPDKSRNPNGYSFIALNYDATSTLNNKDSDVDGIYKKDGLSDASYNIDLGDSYQGNMLINGEDITLGSAVAQIGDSYYGTLAEAVEKAEAGDTITLLKDVEVDSLIEISKSITIDGNDFSLTRLSGDFLIYLTENSEKIEVTLENLKTTGNEKYPIVVGSLADLTIRNSEISGWAALTFYPTSDGASATVYNSVLTGTNTLSDGSNDHGTLVFEDSNVTLDVIDSTVKAIATGAKNQSIVKFSVHNGPNTNDVVTFTGGELVLEKGNSASTFVCTAADATNDIVTVGEGVTANFNPSTYIASGMEVVQPGDKYLVQKYVDRSSSSSSSNPVEPEEPEQPEEPVVEPETPAAPGEVASSTEVTDGGEVAFETTVVDEETGEQSAPAAADSEIKGVVLPTGTEGTVEFVPVSEQAAPAGEEENTKRVFEINVPNYEKGKAAVIKFQMTVAELAADGKTAEQVALWHFDEETGEWTKLVTTFTIVDGIVYFEAITEDFSPFAIIYEDEPAGDMPGDEPETPETPESPAPLLGVLAALGAAVVLRRK